MRFGKIANILRVSCQSFFYLFDMKVSIPVFKDSSCIGMVGCREMLCKAGIMHMQLHETQEPFFNVEFVYFNENPELTAGQYPLQCHRHISEVDATDLVIIPNLADDIPGQLPDLQPFVKWIQKIYDNGAEVASICTGAFVLAETGLLDDKDAATHWVAVDLFKLRYPKVRLHEHKVLVDNGRIYCSGGATSFANLIIYLIEKYCGNETASLASKMFLVDYHKDSQSSYAMFSTQKHHTDMVIRRIQNHIEEHPGENLSIDELAQISSLSRRNFIRRFKQATANTPREYVRRVKVEFAKKLLERQNLTFEEIAWRSGYEDVNSFRIVFKKYTGLNPTAYRQKYRFAM